MTHTAERNSPSLARRHFLSATAGLTGKAIAAAAIAAALTPRSVKADQHPWDHGQHRGGGHHPRGPNCFLAGTPISMQGGEVRIEDIAIGDLIRTTGRRIVAVKWIGRHVLVKTGRSWPENVVPIRVSRSAIDDNVPREDLYLSPGHAIYLNGFLLPVRELVNGGSITPAAPTGADTLEYYQIVLETHAVVWAANLPVETFLARSRTDIEKFSNFAEYRLLYPNDVGPRRPVAPNLGTRWAHLRAGMSCLAGSPALYDVAYHRIAARSTGLSGNAAV